MPMPDLIRALSDRGLRRTGTGWQAKCPSHDDRQASLSVSRGEKGAVLKCHAGCQTADIVRALGLTMASLFDDDGRDNREPGRIVAEYDYRDEHGKRLFQVVRLEPKSFRQRRPLGSAWEWGVEGVRQVPYRLPELIGSGNATVYVVEGEKDADALAERGLTATTNAGGAGKWRAEFSQYLRGRNVVILPDNDSAGESHAVKVASSLAGIAASVRTVRLPGLPPKGDVSDWLAAGGTKAQLMALVDGEQETRVQRFVRSPERVLGERDERMQLGAGRMPFGVRFLDDALGGILPRDLVLLGAKTGIGKTALATSIALHNAQAGKRVHYFALEAEDREIERRMKYQIIADQYYRSGIHLPTIRYLDWHMGNLDRELGPFEKSADDELNKALANLHTFYRCNSFSADDFCTKLREIRDETDLVILDHLHYVDSDDDNENRGYKKMVKQIRDAALNAEKPTVMVAHVRKGDRRYEHLVPTIEDFHGSSDIAKMATKAIMLAAAYDVPNKRPFLWNTYMQVSKCRLDSSVTRYAALVIFNSRTNTYEGHYTLGRLTEGGTMFSELPLDDMPHWASV